MTTIITLAGSPSQNSRSARLLGEAEALLRTSGFRVRRFSVEDFSAEDLIKARTSSPAARELNAAIASAAGLLIASPVYQGSFTAGLKGILDQIQHRGLHGKAVTSLSTSGSIAYRHSLERALHPVFKTLEARHIEPGLNVADQDFPYSSANPETEVPEEVRAYLQKGLSAFAEHLSVDQAAAA